MVQLEPMSKSAEEEPCQVKKQTLLSKYKIPIHYLDFAHVEACTDTKELEKILKILQSGEEGYFPQLIATTEQRLTRLKPNSKLLRKLAPVLQKSDVDQNEWNSLSTDLNNWVQSINGKDQELEGRKPLSDVNYESVSVRKTSHTEPPQPPTKDVKRISSTDYESWDKYDPDTEILKMDLQEEKIKKEANKPVKTVAKKVTFSDFPTEAEAEFQANREKDSGNEYFKTGEYAQAMEYYSNSLKFKPTATVYTNRALTYIKLKQYGKAITDCQAALKYDLQNHKAYIHLAQGHEALHQYDAALEAITKAIEIDPNNMMAQNLANKIRKGTQKIPYGTRLAIQDIQSDRSKENKPEIVPFPGHSSMCPPFYKIIRSKDPEFIEKEKHRILNKPHMINATTIDTNSEDDECCVIHIGKTQKHEKRVYNLTGNKDKFCRDEEEIQVKSYATEFPAKQVDVNNTRERKKIANILDEETICIKNTATTQSSTKLRIQANDNGAGGDPHSAKSFLPPTLDLRSPFSFLIAWNSIAKDESHSKHAQILRQLDMSIISDVIGCNLDSQIFSDVIHSLQKHFTVAGDVDIVYKALVNIITVQRFRIVTMFLSEKDRSCIHALFRFLEQHDKPLPSDVQQAYEQ